MLLTENNKTPLRENKGQNKWKDILGSWFGKLSLIKMAIFLKFIDRANIIPVKTRHLFFPVEMEILILKFI